MANITFPFPFPDHLYALLPEIVVALLAMFLLIADLFIPKDKKRMTAYMALMTVVIAAAVSLKVAGPDTVSAFYGFFVLDPFASFSKLLIYVATFFAIILSLEYMEEEQHVGEYYVLILFSMLGMMLMVSSPNFVTMYLGMELMALSMYVLVGYQRDVLRSSEAALKYFILGALASCVLLYGVTFLYGLTGSFDFSKIGHALASVSVEGEMAMMLGLVFVLSGLAFKVSMAPFHMWTPDAYEGAPTPITAFMSVAPKLAGFAILIRVLHDALPALQEDYVSILMILAVLSMAIGNVAAIAQRNIKRMLAYSTIGHVGFIALGLIAATPDGYAAVLTYLSIYLFMTMGTFAIIILMRRDGIHGELLDDFAGLSKVRPLYALALGLMMFSMAGIPFLGGFWAKYAVIIAVIDAGHLYLALIAVLFSAIGAFYYLRVVKYIYFDDERVAFNFSENRLMQATIAFTTVVVVGLGLYPGELMELCMAALGGLA
ncbi:MAG: NADH-quinone oxidoreductase subunit N [Mariprofundaceae bacterium]